MHRLFINLLLFLSLSLIVVATASAVGALASPVATAASSIENPFLKALQRESASIYLLSKWY